MLTTDPLEYQDHIVTVESYLGHTIVVAQDWFSQSPLDVDNFTVEHWHPRQGFPQLHAALLRDPMLNRNGRIMLTNNDPEFFPRIYQIMTTRTDFAVRAVHIDMQTGNLTMGRCWPGHKHSNGVIWKKGRQHFKSLTRALTLHNRQRNGEQYLYQIDTYPDETERLGFTTPEEALAHATRYINRLVRKDHADAEQSQRLQLEPTRPRLPEGQPTLTLVKTGPVALPQGRHSAEG